MSEPTNNINVNAIDETTAQETPLTIEELACACEDRAATYALLSHLYHKEVDEKYLDVLNEMLYPVSSGNETMDIGHYHIAKYLSNAWFDPITKLSVDYLKTFLGDGIDSHAAAYPFESVYTSEKRLLMQGARDEVLAIYRSCGLDKAKGWSVGEDHLSVELEFMRILCLRAARALREGAEDEAYSLINTQYNFLKDHLRIWVPVFVQDVYRFSKTLFYHGVAELTEGFLQTECELLSQLVGENEEDENTDSGGKSTTYNTGSNYSDNDDTSESTSDNAIK